MNMKYALLALITCSTIACQSGNKEGEQKEDSPKDTTAVEQTVEKASDLVSKEVAYEADGITMKGYLVYDASIEGKRPAVVVVHEWWGHNQHTRNAADKLAKEGYLAFAVDMYGDGKTAEHPKDAKAFSGQVMGDFGGAKRRFNAALDIVKSNSFADSNSLAAIGYCFGGGVVLNMARQGADLDAVATFHGSLGAVEEAEKGNVKAKLLVMNGEDDPFTKGSVEAFKKEMDAAGVDYEFINYPNAVHAFTNPGATEMGEKFNLPLKYNEKVDEASWEELQSFLQEVFYPTESGS